MPQRKDRFFWVYGKQIDGSLASRIQLENETFRKTWIATCPLDTVACVSGNDVSDRVWLFNLETSGQPMASRFNKALSAYLKSLPATFGDPNLVIKRRTALPTPLVSPRLEGFPVTDLGLHSVNDVYNGMLVSYSYYEGRYQHIPHLQLSTLEILRKALEQAWREASCDCHAHLGACCGGVGCYDCFQIDCSNCEGTGWSDFAKWKQCGYQVDYSSGFPMAKY